MIKVISFDCASTLLEVRWRPSTFMMSACGQIGLPASADQCRAYELRVGLDRTNYEMLNLTRDRRLLDEHWVGLVASWMEDMELPPNRLKELVEEMNRQFYETDDWFETYPDVEPCLQALSEKGFRLAVLSNWDYSLHPILESKGLTRYFELVIASLERGVEKPDPALFGILAHEMGVSPEEVLHVGDHDVDDVQGSRNSGMHSAWVARAHVQPEFQPGDQMHFVLNTLTDLPRLLDGLGA